MEHGCFLQEIYGWSFLRFLLSLFCSVIHLSCWNRKRNVTGAWGKRTDTKGINPCSNIKSLAAQSYLTPHMPMQLCQWGEHCILQRSLELWRPPCCKGTFIPLTLSTPRRPIGCHWFCSLPSLDPPSSLPCSPPLFPPLLPPHPHWGSLGDQWCVDLATHWLW